MRGLIIIFVLTGTFSYSQDSLLALLLGFFFKVNACKGDFQGNSYCQHTNHRISCQT